MYKSYFILDSALFSTSAKAATVQAIRVCDTNSDNGVYEILANKR